MALKDYIPFVKKDEKKKEPEPETDRAGSLLKYKEGLKKFNDKINPPKEKPAK